jgi:hypothetical protein
VISGEGPVVGSAGEEPGKLVALPHEPANVRRWPQAASAVVDELAAAAFRRHAWVVLRKVQHAWMESRADGVLLSASQEEMLREIRGFCKINVVPPQRAGDLVEEVLGPEDEVRQGQRRR